MDAGLALTLLDAITFASKSWTLERIFLSLDPLGQLIMAISSQPGARTWMNCRPTFGENQINNDESRAAQCIFFGAQQPCLIGTPAETTDPLGRGIMRSFTAEHNDAHTELLRALAAACMRAGLQWLPEVKELYGPHPTSPPGSTAGCERHMDLFIWQGAYRLLVYATRIDGATDSYLRHALAVSQPQCAATWVIAYQPSSVFVRR